MPTTVKNLDYFYPFDSVNNDRQTTAATERRFYAAMYTSGVVGAGFGLTSMGSYIFRVDPGTAIIGGTVGGLTSASQFLLQSDGYIALRLDTTQAVRSVTLVYGVTVLENDSQEQLAQGGKLDLPLYKVSTKTTRFDTIEDVRHYCSSFDAEEYGQRFNAYMDAIEGDASTRIAALSASFQAAIDAANIENAGLYGAAGRQGFMNPDFSVNQRGADTYGLTTGAAYTFDRWQARVDGRVHSSAVAIGRALDGARSALTIATTPYGGTSGSGASCVCQCIENGVRTFCNGSSAFTVSFDAKADTAQRLAVECTQYPTGEGAGTALAAQAVNLTTQWARYSLTFTGSASAALGASDILNIAFYFAWTGYASRFGEAQDGTNTVYLANVQVNQGSAALPAYIPPYADSLEACKRYFVALDGLSLACGAKLASARQVITSPVPLTRAMRTVPTATTKDRAGVSGVASLQYASGTWANGKAATLADVGTAEYPAFVVTDTGTAEVARVVFGSVVLDAEVYV